MEAVLLVGALVWRAMQHSAQRLVWYRGPLLRCPHTPRIAGSCNSASRGWKAAEGIEGRNTVRCNRRFRVEHSQHNVFESL